MKVLRDAGTVFLRQSLPTWRQPFSLGFGMAQPLVFLVLFGPPLSGITGLPSGSGWLWFVPAVLVMLALFGTTGTGYALLTEMQTGSHQRMLVTPIDRSEPARCAARPPDPRSAGAAACVPEQGLRGT